MKHLRTAFFLSVLVLAHASAPGQTNLTYTWQNLTGQPGGNGNADAVGSVARFFNPGGTAVDSAGNIYVADSGNNTIRKLTSAGAVTTLAGNAEESGSADGTNSTATFDNPSGVAVDNAGNVYVADTYNCTIRKITGLGVVTTLAGSAGQPGSTDGTNHTALFNFPRGVAVDSAGNLYVADSGNNTIRMVTSAGVVTTLAGTPQLAGSVDGTNGTALFDYPCGVAVDTSSTVYVADLDNNSIRKITPSGVVTTFAGMAGFDHYGTPIGGSLDGTNTAARFNLPSGLTVDASNNVYVADTDNATIRKITSAGVVTTLAGTAGQFGSTDGTNGTARFDYPYDVAVDSAGSLFVADFGNSSIRKVTSAGVVTTLAGSAEQSGSTDVTGSAARFNYPYGVAMDSAGNVYVADTDNSTIRKVTANGVVTTLAGSAGQPGSQDGTNGAARFSNPSGVAVDAKGNLYVADTGNNTLREVTGAGVVTTLAGSAGPPGSSDGTNNTAQFNNPIGVAVDGAGTLYVADYGNDTIREMSASGVVTTLAGSPGQPGSTDTTNGPALFRNPTGVTVDGAGNLYVADYGNNTIREVSSNGVVTTLAGRAGPPGSVDGTNNAARFASPYGVAVDDASNVYVGDSFNSTIRKVAVGGVVTTLAGSAGQYGGADGTGSAARFFAPTGVAADNAGDIAVADTGNSTIRKVTSAGVVTTLAGGAEQPGSADDLGSAARFFSPYGVAVNGAGNLYVADTANSTIRKVTSDGGVATLAGSAAQTGSADGTNATALFDYPYGVAADAVGNVYVADTYNSTIREVATNGIVTTLAGTPGEPGSTDGMNGAALFSYPSSVAVDNAGNLYVADSGNDTIRKITSDGTVSTLAGSAGQPGNADGMNSTARFYLPNGIAVDSTGNLYVADSGNNTIRKVTSAGMVTTLAGSAGQPGNVDGAGNAARFNFPRGVAVDSAGYLYVADAGNNTIRKVTRCGMVTTIGGTAGIMGGEDGVGCAANFSGPSGIAVDTNGCLYVADAGNNRIGKGTPMPVLNLTLSAAGVIVCWPAAFPGFVLQQNSDVATPIGWSTASYSVSNDGTNKSITVPSPTGAQFFRLMANP